MPINIRTLQPLAQVVARVLRANQFHLPTEFIRMPSALHVMSTLAVQFAFERALLPAWREAGRDVRMSWDPTAVLARRIDDGERADVLVMIDAPMAALAGRGIVRGDTIRPLARAGFGLAVRAGMPHPDISTPERFRDSLLDAPRVAYSRTGASGRYFATLIERLGIAEAVNERAVVVPAGFTGERVVAGEADLAVQQISELMSVNGVEVVGPFPDALQVNTDFSAAIFAQARDPDEAARFLDHLSSAPAARAFDEGGLAARRAAA